MAIYVVTYDINDGEVLASEKGTEERRTDLRNAIEHDYDIIVRDEKFITLGRSAYAIKTPKEKMEVFLELFRLIHPVYDDLSVINSVSPGTTNDDFRSARG